MKSSVARNLLFSSALLWSGTTHRALASAATERVNELIAEQRELLRASPADYDLAEILAGSIDNAAALYVRQNREDRAQALLAELRTIQRTHLHKARGHDSLTIAPVVSLQSFIDQQNKDEIEATLSECRKLQQTEATNPYFAIPLMDCLNCVMEEYSDAMRAEMVESGLAELRQLSARLPDESTASELGHGLSTAIAMYCNEGNGAKVELLLNELHAVTCSFPESAASSFLEYARSKASRTLRKVKQQGTREKPKDSRP